MRNPYWLCTYRGRTDIMEERNKMNCMACIARGKCYDGKKDNEKDPLCVIYMRLYSKIPPHNNNNQHPRNN